MPKRKRYNRLEEEEEEEAEEFGDHPPPKKKKYSFSDRSATSNTEAVLSRELDYCVELEEISDPENEERRFLMNIPSGQYSKLNASGKTFLKLVSVYFNEESDLAELVGSISVMSKSGSFSFRDPYSKSLRDVREVLRTRHSKAVETMFENFTDSLPRFVGVTDQATNNFSFVLTLPPRTAFYTYDPHILVGMGFTRLPRLLPVDIAPMRDNKYPYGYFNSNNEPLTITSVLFPASWIDLDLKKLASSVLYPYEGPQVGEDDRFNVVMRYMQIAQKYIFLREEAARIAEEAKAAKPKEAVQEARSEKAEEFVPEDLEETVKTEVETDIEEEEEGDESFESADRGESTQDEQDQTLEESTSDQEEREEEGRTLADPLPKQKRSVYKDSFSLIPSIETTILQGIPLWISEGCGADKTLHQFFAQQLEKKKDWTAERKDFLLFCLFQKLDKSGSSFVEEIEDKTILSIRQKDAIQQQTENQVRVALAIKLWSKMKTLSKDLDDEDWKEVVALLYMTQYHRHQLPIVEREGERGKRQTLEGLPPLNLLPPANRNLKDVVMSTFFLRIVHPDIQFRFRQKERENDVVFLNRLAEEMNDLLAENNLSTGYSVVINEETKQVSLTNKEPVLLRKTMASFILRQTESNHQIKLVLTTPTNVINEAYQMEGPSEVTYRFARSVEFEQKKTFADIDHFDIVATGGFVMLQHTGYSYRNKAELTRLAYKRTTSKSIKFDTIHAPANNTEFTFRVYDHRGKIVTFPGKKMCIMFYIY